MLSTTTRTAVPFLAILLFCFAYSFFVKDAADWGDCDSDGNPVGDGCGRCVKVATEGYCSDWATISARLQDPRENIFRQEFSSAVDNLVKIKENGEIVEFSPPSTVSAGARTGTMNYYDAAFFTEADVLRYCNLPSREFKLKMVSRNFEDGNGSIMGAYMSLRDLGDMSFGDILALRKTRVFSITEACHAEAILDPSDQIRQGQGQDTFAYVVNNATASRDDGTMCLAKNYLPTVLGLQKKAADIMAKREQRELEATKKGTDDDEEEAEVEEDEGSLRAKKPPGIQLGTIAARAPAKPKPKAKAKARARSPSPSSQHGGAGNRSQVGKQTSYIVDHTLAKKKQRVAQGQPSFGLHA
jgi:hypothetical protein